MKLGTENRKQAIAAIVLGVVFLAIVGYEGMNTFSTNASTTNTYATSTAEPTAAKVPHTGRHGAASAAGKKTRAAQDLDPTLHLQQLAATEQIKYEGSGRNIFVAQAEDIPTPLASGATGKGNEPAPWQPPAIAQAPPIPLKFFGFASHPGEPKKIFLSKGDDVFVAGEGEIVDRRYKVLRISPNSVEMQDLVGSGSPQTIPLSQG
ncbi:MAG TPA: hypothetical protein VMF10_12065 [Candidatus Aquilonibacter sp.]|nr:hypothetical protein [Candidatus Aquilonibacter sp.]